MNTSKLSSLACQTINTYSQTFTEQHVIVCDTETVKGRPYCIQFYDGVEETLVYVSEHTIFNVYCEYIAAHMKPNLSVWFFYCQFDLPIIHYPYKDYFTYDGHKMGVGHFDFDYVTGNTWFGNHLYKKQAWVERDAFQYVSRSLENAAKDLNLCRNKKPRPSYLGERKPKSQQEKEEFEDYAIEDVRVLWELVYWILGIHRQYNVGLSVSLPDLCGKIFRKNYVHSPIRPTNGVVTLAALASYHGGKTECYVSVPTIVQDVSYYDIVSAYPYAMTQIGNFFDYEIEEYIPSFSPIIGDGVYQVSGSILCSYHPLYSETFERVKHLDRQWVTGYELKSALEHKCFEGVIHEGHMMNSHNGNENGIASYIWDFFKKKAEAKSQGNQTEYLFVKLAMNSLYGKFISKISQEVDLLESWHGGVIFHPLIASLITGFVRGYAHTIEHACSCLHTATDSFMTQRTDFDGVFPGVDGLGSVKKECQGDVLILRGKMYVIFDKVDPSCHHHFELSGETLQCCYCHAKVLKYATHGFFGSIQLLLNMWKGQNVNYKVTRMMRLKEAKKRKDPDVLPFVFSSQKRSLNVDWSKLSLYKGG